MEITKKTSISLSIVISLMAGIITLAYTLLSFASKDYVNAQIIEMKAYVDKDSDRNRKDLEYIRGKVDDIYKFINRAR